MVDESTSLTAANAAHRPAADDSWSVVLSSRAASVAAPMLTTTVMAAGTSLRRLRRLLSSLSRSESCLRRSSDMWSKPVLMSFFSCARVANSRHQWANSTSSVRISPKMSFRSSSVYSIRSSSSASSSLHCSISLSHLLDSASASSIKA